MAISGINYIENGTFPTPPAGQPPSGPTYNHSMTLAIGHYSMDRHGRDTTADSANKTNTITVRSYYTVDTDEKELENFPLTLESLTQLISTRRARTVEAEINPMAITIQERNDALEELGVALGKVSAGLAEFDENDGKGTNKDGVNSTIPGLKATLVKYFTTEDFKDAGVLVDDDAWNYEELRIVNSLIKSRVDKLNNEAQTDMSRMETLVSKRDESFSLATDLTSTISDGRTSMINNMGG